MGKYIYQAILTSEDEGGYSVEVPDLPGCYSCGDDVADAAAMAADAAKTYVSLLLGNGEEVPNRRGHSRRLPRRPTHLRVDREHRAAPRPRRAQRAPQKSRHGLGGLARAAAPRRPSNKKGGTQMGAAFGSRGNSRG